MPAEPPDSPHTRCGQAVADTIRRLVADGRLAGLDVYQPYWEGNRTNVQYPAALVTTTGAMAEAYLPGGNDWDDIGFPVRVAVMDNNSEFDGAALSQYERWRYTIGRAFHGLPLAGVPESVQCQVEPFTVTDEERQAYQLFRSGLVVRCWCRVPVGVD